jgi:predicted nucleic-acid-binding Zn-ribbon protein
MDNNIATCPTCGDAMSNLFDLNFGTYAGYWCNRCGTLAKYTLRESRQIVPEWAADQVNDEAANGGG